MKALLTHPVNIIMSEALHKKEAEKISKVTELWFCSSFTEIAKPIRLKKSEMLL